MRTMNFDMDGVLVDFFGGVQRLLGLGPWEKGSDLTEAYGLTHQTVLEAIEGTPGFWENLEPDKGYKTLLNMMLINQQRGFQNQILTHLPSAHTGLTFADASAAKGKVAWCRKYLPFVPIVITNQPKVDYRCPGDVLIDDSRLSVDLWGGGGFLWPQPWNGGSGFDLNSIYAGGTDAKAQE